MNACRPGLPWHRPMSDVVRNRMGEELAYALARMARLDCVLWRDFLPLHDARQRPSERTEVATLAHHLQLRGLDAGHDECAAEVVKDHRLGVVGPGALFGGPRKRRPATAACKGSVERHCPDQAMSRRDGIGRSALEEPEGTENRLTHLGRRRGVQVATRPSDRITPRDPAHRDPEHGQAPPCQDDHDHGDTDDASSNNWPPSIHRAHFIQETPDHVAGNRGHHRKRPGKVLE